MGYNIDLSFDVLKNSCVKDTALSFAFKYGCGVQSYYDDYEVDKRLNRKRNHCIMTFNFEKTDCMVGFLKNVKETRGLFIENIYDDETESLLYASQFYLTQMMDRNSAKKYKTNRRTRSYSEDDTLILSAIDKPVV